LVHCDTDVKRTDDGGGGAGGGDGGAGGRLDPVPPGVLVEFECGGTVLIAKCQPPQVVVIAANDASFQCTPVNNAFVTAFFQDPAVGPVSSPAWATISAACPGTPAGQYDYEIDTRTGAGESVTIETFEAEAKLVGRFQSADGTFKGTFDVTYN
jgi:hypothetical protein